MLLELGATRIYPCPVCATDTPHRLRVKKGEMYGITCSNCEGASLVRDIELQIYQIKWEEELQNILDSLVEFNDLDDS